MASFKLFIVGAAFTVALTNCKSNTATTTVTTPIPQMSREEGKIITAREISIWEYSKTKQFDKLREILADDYIGYFTTGNMQPSAVINQLRNTTIHSYHLSNINVKPVSENTAIIYYDVLQDVNGADGEKWVAEVASSSV